MKAEELLGGIFACDFFVQEYGQSTRMQVGKLGDVIDSRVDD